MLDKHSLSYHLAAVAGCDVKGLMGGDVRTRRKHICRHAGAALFREHAVRERHADACMRDRGSVQREGDDWEEQLRGTDVAEYVLAMVCDVFGHDAGRRRLGLPVATAPVVDTHAPMHISERLSPDTCWVFFACPRCGACFTQRRAANVHIGRCTDADGGLDGRNYSEVGRQSLFGFWQRAHLVAVARCWQRLGLWE